MTDHPLPCLGRRQALGATAALGVAVPFLAACGQGGDTVDEAADAEANRPTETPGKAIGETADVPVGGCAVFSGAQVVVTQPAAGEFKAFSAICTHQGCLVSSSSSDGFIPCTCHGSQFSLTDGSVEGGPAKSPLPAVRIEVADGEIRYA